MDEIRNSMTDILNSLPYCERFHPDKTNLLKDELAQLIQKEYEFTIHKLVMEELSKYNPLQIDPIQFDDLYQTVFKQKQENYQPFTEGDHPKMVEFNKIIFVSLDYLLF